MPGGPPCSFRAGVANGVSAKSSLPAASEASAAVAVAAPVSTPTLTVSASPMPDLDDEPMTSAGGDVLLALRKDGVAGPSPAATTTSPTAAAGHADAFDMFSDDGAVDVKRVTTMKHGIAGALNLLGMDTQETELRDNWTDNEGYYKVCAVGRKAVPCGGICPFLRPRGLWCNWCAQANIGEVLDGRYKILGTSGRGVFSTVLICEDLVEGCRVAIKVIKTNETMRRAGEKELELLEVTTQQLLALI